MNQYLKDVIQKMQSSHSKNIFLNIFKFFTRLITLKRFEVTIIVTKIRKKKVKNTAKNGTAFFQILAKCSSAFCESISTF